MTKVNFNKLVSDEAIIAAINSLHNRAETLQLDVHKVLVGICARWHEVGDYRPAVAAINLLLEKGKLGGMRTNAVRQWVETFMGLMVVAEGDDKGKFMCPKPKVSGKHLVMAELVNRRWWEFKPEAEYKPMDFDKLWATMVKKGKQRVAEGVKEADNIDLGMIEAMQKARADYLASKAVN